MSDAVEETKPIKTTTRGKKVTDYSDPSYWQNFTDRLAREGEFIFVKDQPVRVRLVHAHPNLPPIERFETEFMGNTQVQFMVHAFLTDDINDGEPVLKGLVLKAKAAAEITKLLAEGHALFDNETGHALKLERHGTGSSTKWTAQVSPKPQPLDGNCLAAIAEADLLREMVAKQIQRNADRNEKGGKDNQPF